MAKLSGPTVSSQESLVEPEGTLVPTEPNKAGSSLDAIAFDRYVIIKELGRGAMGAVYLAQDKQLDRRVALKMPHFRATAAGFPGSRRGAAIPSG